ncbi:DUF2273 domain-containing protein [Isobaculum melis]|nr:DUF2273 domain-containing protein [Isobaculum melis]
MQDWMETYKWPIIGAILGFILAMLFLTIGFFKTILIVLLTIVGGFIGYFLNKTGILVKITKK